MKPKFIPPEKMYLLDEFNAAQEAEANLSETRQKHVAAGKIVSTAMLELEVAAFRRTLEARIAIDNLQ